MRHTWLSSSRKSAAILKMTTQERNGGGNGNGGNGNGGNGNGGNGNGCEVRNKKKKKNVSNGRNVTMPQTSHLLLGWTPPLKPSPPPPLSHTDWQCDTDWQSTPIWENNKDWQSTYIRYILAKSRLAKYRFGILSLDIGSLICHRLTATYNTVEFFVFTIACTNIVAT